MEHCIQVRYLWEERLTTYSKKMLKIIIGICSQDIIGIFSISIVYSPLKNIVKKMLPRSAAFGLKEIHTVSN